MTVNSRLEVVTWCEIQLLLHSRDVGLGGFDIQATGGSESEIGPDVALDEDHVPAGDVLVLAAGPLIRLSP